MTNYIGEKHIEGEHDGPYADVIVRAKRFGVDIHSFSEYKEYDKIVVAGPQRSGTHFTATAASNDLNYLLIFENSIHGPGLGFRNMPNFERLCSMKDKFVLQCTDLLVDAEDLPDDVLLVVTVRPIADIVNSQNKIEWPCYEVVRGFYRDRFGKIADSDLPVSAIRYKVWNEIQRHNVKCKYIELDYNSMKAHPMWVDYINRPKNRNEYGAGWVWGDDQGKLLKGWTVRDG